MLIIHNARSRRLLLNMLATIVRITRTAIVSIDRLVCSLFVFIFVYFASIDSLKIDTKATK